MKLLECIECVYEYGIKNPNHGGPYFRVRRFSEMSDRCPSLKTGVIDFDNAETVYTKKTRKLNKSRSCDVLFFTKKTAVLIEIKDGKSKNVSSKDIEDKMCCSRKLLHEITHEVCRNKLECEFFLFVRNRKGQSFKEKTTSHPTYTTLTNCHDIEEKLKCKVYPT